MTERSASVEISTSNPRCADACLAAQLDWATPHFSNFQFAIGDTLQVYNYLVLGHPLYGGRLSESFVRKVCAVEGDTWLEKHLPIIDSYLEERTYVIRRWDELLEEEAVRRNLRQFETLYATDKHIFDLVRQDVVGYVNRRHPVSMLTDAQWEMLDRHVLEELAVYQYQAEFGNFVSLYPGANQLLLRPKHLASANLPDSLKGRHYVSFDIKLLAEPVGAVSG